MKSFIVSHDSRLLEQEVAQNDLPCNCTRSVCPLPDRTPPNNCRQNDIIYQGTITNNDDGEVKTYIGSTADPLKARVSNHRTTFRDENKKNYNEMAKEIHRIKGFTRNYSIEWEIIDKGVSHKVGSKSCNLCILEKYHILYKHKPTDLNNFRLEPCLHKKKNFLIDAT